MTSECVCVVKGDSLSTGKPRRHFGQAERRRHQDRRSTNDLQHARVQLSHAAGARAASHTAPTRLQSSLS